MKKKNAMRVLSLALVLGMAATSLPTENLKADETEITVPVADVEDYGVEGEDYAADQIVIVYDDADDAKVNENAIERKLEKNDIEVTEEVATATEDTGTAVTADISDSDLNIAEAIAAAESIDGVAYAQPNYKYSLVDFVESEDAETENAESTESTESSETTETAETEESTESSETTEAVTTTSDSKELTASTNDAFYSKLYYLGSYTSGTSYGTNAATAWDTVKASHNVTVAVIDSGCETTHEDLKNNLNTKYAYNAVYDSVGAAAVADYSYEGHGTHVCGCIAAQANNSVGTAGTSYNATILPIKVCDKFGDIYTSYMVSAYNYLDELIETKKVTNLHVINMSIGGESTTQSAGDYALESAIAELKDNHDVVTVCAAGNSSHNESTYHTYPSDFSEVISVTATDSNGNPASFSNYGASKDIAAPGVDILSTVSYENDVAQYGSGYTKHAKNASYCYLSGTSMASPITAGIIALLFAYNPDLTFDQVYAAITKSASSIVKTSSTSSNNYGTGIVNASAALSYVIKGSYPKSVQTVTLGTSSITEMCSYDDPVDITATRTSGSGTLTYVSSDENVVKVETYAGKTYARLINPGKAYIYVYAAGNSSYYKSKTQTITVNSQPKNPEVMDVANSAKGITIKWTSAKNASGYIVYKSSNNGSSFSKAATLSGASKKSWTDTKVTSGKLYYYYVVSYKTTAGGTVTGDADLLLHSYCARPTSITKLGSSGKKIQVSWKKVSGITGYNIQISSSSSFASSKTKNYTMSASKTSGQTPTKYTKGKTYYVRVRTYKTSGNYTYTSSWSATKKIKVK